MKGDACDVESFTAALEGKDAVLSSLGDHALHANIFNPTTLYTESMHAITEGMRRFVILLVNVKIYLPPGHGALILEIHRRLFFILS